MPSNSHVDPSNPCLSMRKPQRITITVPWSLYRLMLETSDQEGRSLSNMAANWLERQAKTYGNPPL